MLTIESRSKRIPIIFLNNLLHTLIFILTYGYDSVCWILRNLVRTSNTMPVVKLLNFQ